MSKARKISIIIIVAIVLLILISLKAKATYMDEMINEPEHGTSDKFSTTVFKGGTPGSKNFNVSEFACNDGTPVPQSLYANVQTLIDQLQILRDATGLPITINSGYRTKAHNKSVGGATNSMHLQAGAADIVVIGMTSANVRKKIQQLINEGKMRNGGIGAYPNFTHYDIGPVRRW